MVDMLAGLSVADVDRVIRQEARRQCFRYADFVDRVQDGWVILLEAAPNNLALARTVVRRRLLNLLRRELARKRGGGCAIGRLDAGWSEKIGTADPTDDLLDTIAGAEALRALNIKAFLGSRQAQHQSIARAKNRWLRLRKPFDP